MRINSAYFLDSLCCIYKYRAMFSYHCCWLIEECGSYKHGIFEFFLYLFEQLKLSPITPWINTLQADGGCWFTIPVCLPFQLLHNGNFDRISDLLFNLTCVCCCYETESMNRVSSDFLKISETYWSWWRWCSWSSCRKAKIMKNLLATWC